MGCGVEMMLKPCSENYWVPQNKATSGNKLARVGLALFGGTAHCGWSSREIHVLYVVNGTCGMGKTLLYL